MFKQLKKDVLDNTLRIAELEDLIEDQLEDQKEIIKLLAERLGLEINYCDCGKPIIREIEIDE